MTMSTHVSLSRAGLLDPPDLQELAPDLQHYHGPIMLVLVDEAGRHLVDVRWASADFVMAVLSRLAEQPCMQPA